MVKTLVVTSLVAFMLAATTCPTSAAAGIDRNARAIDGRTLLTNIKKLASDEFEGRSPSSKGEALTIQYVSEQFRAAVVRNLDVWYDAFKPAPSEKLYLAPHRRVKIW